MPGGAGRSDARRTHARLIRALRAWCRIRGLPAAVLVFVTAAASGDASPPAPDFAAASRAAERTTAPEPLSSWAAVETEIGRLVARGELPLEALTLRPLDRGELAAWLSAGAQTRPSATGADAAVPAATDSPSRRRLQALLRWELDHLAGAAPAGEPPARPGALIRERDGERELLVGPYVRLGPTLRDGEHGDWTDSTRVGVRGILLLGSRVAFCGGLFAAEVAEGREFADPLVAGTDLILHEEQMTVTARAAGLRLRLGRDRHRWGPGRTGTLLLSDAGEPFNFLEYQVRLGARLRFTALMGATSLHRERYLAAHRLTWTPRPNVSIAVAEGARYQANGLHLLYAAGCVPYTLVERFDFQDNLDQEDRLEQRNNVLWSCDVVWRPRPGCLCYGEVLADDIGTEDEETPSRGAYQAGILLAPRWRGWDWSLGLEHTRVSNFTYAVYYQDLCACDWEHQHESLGYGEGPDVAVTEGRCTVDFSSLWGGAAWVGYLARGEGRLGDAWFPSSTGCAAGPQCGPVSAWNLTGDVRRAWSLGLSVLIRPAPALRFGLWGMARHIADDGVPEDEGWGSLVGLCASAGME